MSRAEVVQAALVVAHRRGLDQLTLRDVATELGITPTAVLWYVRTKKELMSAVVAVALRHVAPPERGNGSWPTELVRIFAALRHEMLANRNLLATAPFGQGVPVAFARFGLASARVLDDAGFTPSDLRLATQTLVRHAVGLAALEMALDAACDSPRVREFGVRQATAKLSAAEAREVARSLADRRSSDTDPMFTYGLRCLVRGLERQLDRRALLRGTGTSSNDRRGVSKRSSGRRQ